PDHDHYRSRLSPGLPTNCVCGYGNGRLWRAAIATPGGSGEVLSQSRSPGNEGAGGDGSQWACTLVRATAGGAEHRVMDWRRGGDSHETSAQAEDGSRGCPAAAALDAGRLISADLGRERGESRSAATSVAPAPDGAGAHPVDEPVASGSSERRAALQEEVMAGARGGKKWGVFLYSPGQPAQ